MLHHQYKAANVSATEMVLEKRSYEEFINNPEDDTGLPRNTRLPIIGHTLIQAQLPLPAIVIIHFLQSQFRLETFQSWPTTASKSPRELIDGYLTYTGYLDTTYCYICRKIKGKWTSSESISSGHEDACVTIDNGYKRSERFWSFLKWRDSKAIDLAEWGFKCMKNGVTMCVYCEKIKDNWGEIDNPITGHAQTCLFLLYILSRYDGCFQHVQSILRNLENRNTESLAIPNIVLSHFLRLGVRLATFQCKWPKYAEKTPDALAKNMLSYARYVDRTYCYFCLKGISQWQDTDEIMQSGHNKTCVVLDGGQKRLKRYMTYVKWPGTQPVKFAEMGLYCIGLQQTKCEYCGLVKTDWNNEDDNPVAGHTDTCHMMMFKGAHDKVL